MPNIEIHGFGQSGEDVRKRIREVFEDAPNAGDIVTTIYPTIVTTNKGERDAYLRVVSTARGFKETLPRLMSLGYGIEVLVLDDWIPPSKTG